MVAAHKAEWGGMFAKVVEGAMGVVLNGHEEAMYELEGNKGLPDSMPVVHKRMDRYGFP